jgi:SNF2 family DNA or RNA helicase
MLANRIKNFSYRITKKECLDLPDKIYVTRDVELTPEQKKLYKEMKDLSFAMDDGDIMSVQVALTKLLRLHQILCGSFTTDEGETKRIPNNRLTALGEVLDETSGKVIIWANYLQNIADIKELLAQKFGPETFVTYIGDTSSDDRVEAIKLFQNANSPVRFFLGNVQTAGRGITLTAANTVVYYSNNYSLEMRQQSEDRAHRVGQVNPVTYVDLIARNSLDEKIIQALLAKRSIANEILHDDLEDWIKL